MKSNRLIESIDSNPCRVDRSKSSRSIESRVIERGSVSILESNKMKTFEKSELAFNFLQINSHQQFVLLLKINDSKLFTCYNACVTIPVLKCIQCRSFNTCVKMHTMPEFQYLC